MMDRDFGYTDRYHLDEFDDRTSLNIGEQFNDPDKVNDFKKKFEEFAIDEEEDLMGEMSQIIPDSRPYNKELYSSILLNARSSRNLCQKFYSEPCGLQKSDAKGQDMSFGEMFKRMQTGHKVYKYNYNNPSRKIVTIKINDGTIEIYASENKKSRVGFSDVYGITLGACTSTFKMYKKQIDYKIGKLHEHEDCFSIIDELRSYDFASTSNLARYDICISLSWLCSLKSSLQSTIPFTKCKNYSDFLSYKNIMDKLKKEAQTRLISLHELFLLGIYKTLKQLENQNGMNKIIVILNKRFTFAGKLYRFVRYLVMPLIASDSYIRKDLKDQIRINLLLNNKLKFLSNIIDRKERNVDKLEAKTKNTVMESMIVSSCKSIFKSSGTSDPFLAVLRQKAKK